MGMSLDMVVGLNLERRFHDKGMAWIGAMQSRGVPPEKIEIYKAFDGSLYDRWDEVFSIAMADFPDIYKHPAYDGWIPQVWACIYSFHLLFREISKMDKGQAVLLMIDDTFLTTSWRNLQEIVYRLGELEDDFMLLQLHHWGEKSKFFPNPVPEIHEISRGLAGAGDNALVLSANGAEMLLDWYADKFHGVIEHHLNVRSAIEYPGQGIYSVLESSDWVGSPIRLNRFTGKPDSETGLTDG